MTTYEVRTFGCQMNKHDSERIAGMLEERGLTAAPDGSVADVVVFNTCCVREKADERLYGQVASLSTERRTRPGMLIAVGGCIGQRDGAKLLAQLPHVDVVFGTHNIASLPALLDAAAESPRGLVEVAEPSADDFTSALPSRREHPWHAWVPIAVGCDNRCTYCIVPTVRGPERSRPVEDILGEVRRLVSEGVVEVTLLGQNVNSYGRDLYGTPRFAQLLREVAAAGVQLVRFTTSHPKDLSAETIAAMAETPQVARHLHLPAQSGSDAVLKAMGRRYTSADYLALVRRVREAVPDIALTTDIIVGFPGETDADFEDTMRLVEEARYDAAFTFIYSRREGTPAARMAGQLDREVVQARFDRLVAAIQSSALEHNLPLAGTVQRVLVEGASKRDPGVIIGRTGSNKVVHAPLPEGTSAKALAGTFVEVEVLEAQTWFLMGRVRG